MTLKGKVNKMFSNLLEQSSNEEKGISEFASCSVLVVDTPVHQEGQLSSVLHRLLDSSERLILPSTAIANSALNEQPPLKPKECWLMEKESSAFRTILLILKSVTFPLCKPYLLLPARKSRRGVVSPERHCSIGEMVF